MNSHCCRIA